MEAFAGASKNSFQFTHPVRGATETREAAQLALEFQFTHPVRGATLRTS